MKNYLKPYTMCTRVESEGYLLAGTGQANAGQFSQGGSGRGSGTRTTTTSDEEKLKTEGYSSSAKGVFFESED